MAETADEKNARLELEIQEMKIIFEGLERRCNILESENHAYRDDLVEMKRENHELKAKIAALEGIRFANANGNAKEGAVNFIVVKDEDEVFELMAENAALKCEKDMAVKETEKLRGELVELVSQSLATYIRKQTGENLRTASPLDGPTYWQVDNCNVDTGSSHMVCSIENKKNVKKQLLFEEDKSPAEKVAPRTPGATNHSAIGVINLVDSDDELAGCEDLPSAPTQKRRRRPFNVIAGDSESDDDNIPISKLMRMHLQDGPRHPSAGSISINQNVGTSRQRHFKRLRKFSPRVEEDDSAETDDTDSNSRSDDSLGGFIVDDSEVSYMEDDQLEDNSNLDDSADSLEGSTRLEDSSDEDGLISVIQSASRRSKGHWKQKWECEADMLAAFGKSPELCMEAVCAIYRQQTDDEKLCKDTVHINGRGFSKFDATRGSDIAEFLTGGDPYGGLKKSLQELEEHDPKAPELCQNLAARYSRQLFGIYTNEEDPFFCPDCISKLI
ncbi:hypothetical protein MLD38_019851 [Melastoma candidum]|uniref:Uncharacterized protein n=1 Tax=Melastoma candidum TaxID=119954 RepID=A0ACB9QAR5_9MYRT|nr:hypothetical protein MLD38_019851 [Melastoma candidum]